jgi:hypothetical protein
LDGDIQARDVFIAGWWGREWIGQKAREWWREGGGFDAIHLFFYFFFFFLLR